MSMLAERKIKQKWSLNPRGKAWSEDSNKFGQKILEKMGWSPGKGLGAKEDGVTEHVKVSYKNDSKGMGYKESDNQWTEHDSNFNAFLQSLSGENTSDDGEIKISSLERKSQSSKVRVHYKKFTRGKDLSRCTEKDLANIFGKKSLKDTTNQPKDCEESNDSNKSDSFTFNGGSMLDYFKKKLPNFAKNIENNEVESDSEPAYNGFGFKNEDNKKKKRKSNGEVADHTPKKIKCEDEATGLSNPAFDPLFGNVEVQKHVLNTIEEEENEDVDDCEIKKKKKKKRNYEDIDNSTESVSFEVERKKKKKKKKQKETGALDNPNFDDDDGTNCHFDEKFEIKRKNNYAIENPTFDDSSFNEDSNVHNNEDFEVKRKKKKKKKQDLAIDNPSFQDAPIEDEEKNNSSIQTELNFDLILNVTSTPSLAKIPQSSSSSAKKRKSVRFSDVREERIIPNNEDIENRNELFDINSKVIENSLKDTNFDEISKKIDGFQAEIENDINEAKMCKFIGEVGQPDGENEKLPEGTKLKFKYANFGKSPTWAHKNTSKATSAYKHLIKGDIILGFNNTNLHEIDGYGVKKNSK